MSRQSTVSATVLVVHPSSDVYGADLQLLESVEALTRQGMAVIAVTPREGPLDSRLTTVGASVTHQQFPVVRKEYLTPRGIFRFALAHLTSLTTAVRLIRRHKPRVIYVNTITIPLWIAAAQLTRTKTLCHVHEAEDDVASWLQRMLVAPLHLASAIVVNSTATNDFITRNMVVRRTVRLIYNGISENPIPRQKPLNDIILYTGRLSPRKGVDTLVDAFAMLLEANYRATLLIAGTAFPGYEWFVEDLHARISAGGTSSSVQFLGYRDDVYSLLSNSTVAVVPSRQEPFGNTAVEAQMSGTPLICARVQGLLEIAEDGTAITFEPSSAKSLFDALCTVLDNASQSEEMAEHAQLRATQRFGKERYQIEMYEIVNALSGDVPR